ncbi:1,5-anhydro-D-fructose reductase [Limihaloglobus sulfuriphilus]|uniref:1,5-anhydro-D-fructose reductase n=1 Tax=Limihaloglobus sulfuriphilus TaxID=1851148 RepID=A0A1Q2MH14_9BACT|nr:Gfo/Idh/MocA family oxidoreductase [Limihaloglobus sulfuriphilus]AQQ71995.1 1,5-anhydro-D-fructose reductase [Limihaloglobus sulfuriphilus]
MIDTLHWGIIGCGNIAASFAKGLRDVDGARLIAAASRSAQKAARFSQENGALRSYGSYEDLLDDREIDVVYIATPHHLHMENSLMAIEAGKHVLCEKPISINSKQATRMADAARQAGVFLMEGMWTRFIPAVEQLQDWLSDGIPGGIHLFTADFGVQFNVDDGHRIFNSELGGGALLDLGVYPVSLASLIFKRQPDTIQTQVRMHATGVDELNTMLFDYKSGPLAVITSGSISRTPTEAFIAGKKLSIKIHSPLYCPSALTLFKPDGTSDSYEFPLEGNGFNYEAAHVCRCLRKGMLQSDVMPVSESISIMETLDSIRAQWGLRYPMD